MITGTKYEGEVGDRHGAVDTAATVATAVIANDAR
jgi:hypothetical protein